MYNKDYFINEFKRLGLKETDTVFSHTSYKKIAGDVGIEGGADTLIDAFISYFGEKGLVVFPSMTWKLGWLINDRGEMRDPSLGPAEGFYPFGSHFDVRTTSCDYLGIIPELFRQKEGVIRSLSPSSSVSAYGSDAAAFCAGHEKSKGPLSWDSPWGKLYERGAKILFLGSPIGNNTFLHAIEERAKVPGLIAPYVWHHTVTDYNGNTFPVSYKRHEPHHSIYYYKMEAEFLANGIARKVTFGSAQSYIIDAVLETDYMLKKLQEIPLLFTDAYNKSVTENVG